VEDIERRGVVAKVRSAEANGVETVTLEEIHGTSDRLSLTAPIQRRVVTVHETVQRELHATLREFLHQHRMSLEHAGRGGPRWSDPEV
jgi:hypothetical protein